MGSAIAVHGGTGYLTVLGAPMAQQRPQKLVWRTGRKGTADRRCLSSSWKEEAGRRGMHLVLRCLCAKQLLEQRGAVYLLSGGAFLSDPHWLLNVNGSFVEWLKCMKEIRWGCVFFFPTIINDAFCKNRWPDQIIFEGWSRAWLFFNHSFKGVLVLLRFVLSIEQKAFSGEPGDKPWPRISSQMNSTGCLTKITRYA